MRPAYLQTATLGPQYPAQLAGHPPTCATTAFPLKQQLHLMPELGPMHVPLLPHSPCMVCSPHSSPEAHFIAQSWMTPLGSREYKLLFRSPKHPLLHSAPSRGVAMQRLGGKELIQGQQVVRGRDSIHFTQLLFHVKCINVLPDQTLPSKIPSRGCSGQQLLPAALGEKQQHLWSWI